MKEDAHDEAAAIIQKRVGCHFKAKIAIVLGSGLGDFVNHIENPVVISYKDLPGFHFSHVKGHGNQLYLGHIHNVPVAVLQGRPHFYEGVDNRVFQTMVRTLKLVGCQIWVATNASGSLKTDIKPGNLVLIKDHINFQFNNPLTGENNENFGERFVPMEAAYDPTLQRQFIDVAKKLKIILYEEGVYMGVLGPSFETPSEIRVFQQLGAHVVGMSTIPEVIVARHCDMRVAALSVVSNMAVGLSNTKVTHEEALKVAKQAAKKLQQLVLQFIIQINSSID